MQNNSVSQNSMPFDFYHVIVAIIFNTTNLVNLEIWSVSYKCPVCREVYGVS